MARQTYAAGFETKLLPLEEKLLVWVVEAPGYLSHIFVHPFCWRVTVLELTAAGIVLATKGTPLTWFSAERGLDKTLGQPIRLRGGIDQIGRYQIQKTRELGVGEKITLGLRNCDGVQEHLIQGLLQTSAALRYYEQPWSTPS